MTVQGITETTPIPVTILTIATATHATLITILRQTVASKAPDVLHDPALLAEARLEAAVRQQEAEEAWVDADNYQQ